MTAFVGCVFNCSYLWNKKKIEELEVSELKPDKPLHAAVIMDGNGRWAEARGLTRSEGHRAGVDALIRTIEKAPDAGVSVLTVFAFSSDNWRRPTTEVQVIMKLLSSYVRSQVRRCVQQGVRMQFIGRRDRLGPDLCLAIERAEAGTLDGKRLWLRLAVDYSGRDSILEAARKSPELSRRAIEEELGPTVDLLIRTGGEHRLSDFLLWESAYAELVFSRKMWPDFSPQDFCDAVSEYHCRERRFGSVTAHAVRRNIPA